MVSQFLPLLLLTSSALSQHIFINQVPLYSSLSQCAEKPLSTIVRDMVFGCGDGGHTTSYACFCTSSSSHFSSLISSQVSTNCITDSAAAAEVTEAVKVFGSYCEMGNSVVSTTTTPGMCCLTERQTEIFVTEGMSTAASGTSSATSRSAAVSYSSQAPIPSSTSSAARRDCSPHVTLLLGVITSLILSILHI